MSPALDRMQLPKDWPNLPSEGFKVNQILTSPDEITVAGNTDALDTLAAGNNTITIPADRVSVEGLSDDMTVDVTISRAA